MHLDAERARSDLKEFDFKDLFIQELGWDRYNAALTVPTDGQTFTLNAMAEKRGMVAFLCQPAIDGRIPDYATRRKIERLVSKSALEHLIVYVDADKTTQVWQWVKREAGKPAACREHTYSLAQSGDALVQKLGAIAFSLEEEEQGIPLIEVTSRVRAGFDVERVTRHFYDRFKSEHDKFLKFLIGIPDEDMQKWYVSVMLNRLMFIYFIQKKGFLDGDTSYLRNRLSESKKRGGDRFYRDFLCPLFFEGFAKKESERSAPTNALLGNVPYLNGGLFLRHQIEERHGKDIQIADAAFAKIFAFFDEYQWHLDDRPLRNDNEINPDVLGFIFEKYINQKQMGAYYTKEDITGYISQNTIIPSILDAAAKEYPTAFNRKQTSEVSETSEVWALLQADPDRYIYDAVKHGMALPLPPEIEAGVKEVSKRTEWNKPAPAEYALPTEIWREVVARRQRYGEVRAKLVSGEIREINDLITYNLNIRQFAQEVIEDCRDPEALRAFWHAIERITVLDPTVGSGAFLFAALNILEALYEACLDRMQVFLEELARSGEKHRPEKFSDFRQVLDRVAQHPNRPYFIFKSIIVNNLYGVDIMEEAVEICKLRLFLKLVAQVDSVDKIEPLPDIDFNIRAGNTLVGFATQEQVKGAITTAQGGQIKMLSGEELDTTKRIDESAEIADRAFKRFREMQTEHGMEAKDFADAKRELGERLKKLEDELNGYLATEYGVSPRAKTAYTKWLESHKPFHWFVEFYGILKRGGFDVIVGNPPYVEYSKVKKEYTIKGYQTEPCGNLYAFVVERTFGFASQVSRIGLIVMLNITFGAGYELLRREIASKARQVWVSSYDNIPDGLFAGSAKTESINTNKVVSQRVCIVLSHVGKNTTPLLATSRFLRWNRDYRALLFTGLEYGLLPMPSTGSWVAFGSGTAISIFKRLAEVGSIPLELLISETGREFLQMGATPRYFISAVPEELNRSGIVEIRFPLRDKRQVAEVILNSNLFYYYWRATGDGFHLTRTTILKFPVASTLIAVLAT